MDHLKHKQSVKFVAIVDIIISTLAIMVSIPGVLILLFVSHAFVVAAFEKYKEFDRYYESPFSKSVKVLILTLVAVLVLLLLALEIMKLVAAVKLLKASESVTKGRRAYDNCHFWKIVNVTYLVVNVFTFAIGLVYGNQWYTIFNLVMLILHMYFLCIVCLYSHELKTLREEPTENFQSLSATCETNVLPRNLEFTPGNPPSYYTVNKQRF